MKERVRSIMKTLQPRSSVGIWMKEIGKYLGEGQTRDALFCINKTVENTQTDPERAEALNFKVLFFLNENVMKKRFLFMKKFLRRISIKKKSFFEGTCSESVFGQIFVLSKLEREEEALFLCDEIIQKFQNEQSPTVKRKVAEALVVKGIALY